MITSLPNNKYIPSLEYILDKNMSNSIENGNYKNKNKD
jgi:hypothetical protein